MDIERIKQAGLYRIAGIISGTLLMLPNIYAVLAPLSLIAFVPILYVCAIRKSKLSNVAIAGLYMALAYTIPQMILLKLPAVITIVLLLYLSVIMITLSCATSVLIKRGNLRGSLILTALAVASLFCITDWINISAVPIWATAQSLARSWSSYPSIIAFSCFTGIVGIIFTVAFFATLIVSVIIEPKSFRRATIYALLAIALIAGLDFLAKTKKPSGKITVAAIGYSSNEFPRPDHIQTDEGFDEVILASIKKATDLGAKIIVTPEMGFYFDKYNKQEWVDKFKSIAAQYDILLIIGYYDLANQKNQVAFISGNNEQIKEYSKTHLIPYEQCKKGCAALKTVTFNGIRVGAMICQDDNFTDLSRRYSREKVPIVAVPTSDWKVVRYTHLQSSIHRAIESRYAIIRAAVNGVSAIISPRGKILASCDHIRNHSAVITAEVNTYNCTTVFGKYGYWFVGVCGVYIAIFLIVTNTKNTG